jgi:integrase
LFIAIRNTKEYSLADGYGLFVRIKPNGSKAWIFNYSKPYTKKRTNLGIGSFPTVTLAKAREKRMEYRKQLTEDIDPKEYRDNEVIKQRAAHLNTLEAITAQWLEVKRTGLTEDHSKDIRRSLEIHIFPNLGKIPISKITAPKAIAALKPLAAKGSLETVKRVCQRLNEVMIFAVNTGVIFSNPLAGIKASFASPEKNNMPTILPEQLPELMCALNTASIKLVTRCLIEWQLYTMTRPKEAAGARWEEIDFNEKVWNIPGERMKAKRPHSIPLTDQALALLNIMKPISEHLNYIFPSDRNQHRHIHEQSANMALKRMGFKNKLVAHGLRALASTTLNEQGFDGDVIEAALAHIDKNETRKAYNRATYLERRRTMMCWWSEHIERAAMGNMSLTATRNLIAV